MEDQASASLTVIMLVFLLAVVVTLTYLVLYQNRLTTLVVTDYTTPHVLNHPTTH